MVQVPSGLSSSIHGWADRVEGETYDVIRAAVTQAQDELPVVELSPRKRQKYCLFFSAENGQSPECKSKTPEILAH